MRACSLLSAAVFLAAPVLPAPAAEPIFHEALETTTPTGPNVTLQAPSAIGEGRFGSAALLEARTLNHFSNAALHTAAPESWILMGGALLREGQLVLQKGSLARQVVDGLTPGGLYCFSLVAASTDGRPARFTLDWDGADADNTEEFEVTSKEPVRFWVSGKAMGGSATATVRGVSGSASITQPQFEAGGTHPSSFIEKGPRGVSGLTWKPGEGEFNLTQGSASFWVKPLWAGGTFSSAKTLFAAANDPETDWKEARSAVILNAWLLDPSRRDWGYALVLRITDRNRKSEVLSAPIHDLTPEWHHVAITWNFSDPENGRAAIYLDGAVVTQADRVACEGLEDANSVAFGQGQGGYLGGWLDEARTYKTELGAEEIQQLSRGEE